MKIKSKHIFYGLFSLIIILVFVIIITSPKESQTEYIKTKKSHKYYKAEQYNDIDYKDYYHKK